MMFHEFQIERDRLKKIKFREPDKAGGRWCGVPHHQTVDTVERALKLSFNPKVVAERFWVSTDGTDLAACFDFKSDKAPIGYNASIGFVVNNARKRALTLFAGYSAKDETHGVAMTEIGACMNTTNWETALEQLVAQPPEWGEMLEQWERMSSAELGRSAVAFQMIEACRRPFRTRFQWSRLGYVDAAHRNIQKDPKRRTSLTMALAFAQVLPRTKPMFQMDVMSAIVYKLPM